MYGIRCLIAVALCWDERDHDTACIGRYRGDEVEADGRGADDRVAESQRRRRHVGYLIQVGPRDHVGERWIAQTTRRRNAG